MSPCKSALDALAPSASADAMWRSVGYFCALITCGSQCTRTQHRDTSAQLSTQGGIQQARSSHNGACAALGPCTRAVRYESAIPLLHVRKPGRPSANPPRSCASRPLVTVQCTGARVYHPTAANPHARAANPHARAAHRQACQPRSHASPRLAPRESPLISCSLLPPAGTSPARPPRFV
eukprot:6195282-Pleurochrysis_carterae.AAC.1